MVRARPPAPSSLWVAVAFVVVLPLALDPWGFQQRLPVAWWWVLAIVPFGFALTVRSAGEVAASTVQLWWLALVGVLVLATLVGVAPLTSLIGSPARRLGLIGWLALGLACWWGVQLGRRPGAVDVIARAAVTGSVPVSVIGLVERGERFFSFGSGVDLVRSASTLRNAAFLGAYLALVVPLAARLALAVARRWRIVAAAATVLGLATLVFSQTRAAWLGTLAGFAILAVVERRARGRDGRRLPWLVGAGAVVAVAVLAVAPVRDPALSVASLGEGSARARTLLWARTLPAIAHRPLLGYGPDATVVAYPRYIDATFERDVTRRTLPDRAHTPSRSTSRSGAASLRSQPVRR